MMIGTSEIKVSCVIGAKHTDLAVRVLHDAFGLGEKKGKKQGKTKRLSAKKKVN
jgi:aspartate kinase